MAVKPLIGFGIAIFLAGMMFRMYNDVITDFFSKYILNTGDKYYLMSDMIWNSLPYIIIFLGITCLIFGSVLPAKKIGGE